MHSELQSIHPDNYRNLRLIEESIMVVTLEEDNPQNESEVGFLNFDLSTILNMN